MSIEQLVSIIATQANSIATLTKVNEEQMYEIIMLREQLKTNNTRPSKPLKEKKEKEQKNDEVQEIKEIEKVICCAIITKKKSKNFGKTCTYAVSGETKYCRFHQTYEAVQAELEKKEKKEPKEKKTKKEIKKDYTEDYCNHSSGCMREITDFKNNFCNFHSKNKENETEERTKILREVEQVEQVKQVEQVEPVQIYFEPKKINLPKKKKQTEMKETNRRFPKVIGKVIQIMPYNMIM